ncbi:1-acyl-sn-glycerol-3-phosphate acyltransferase [Aquicella siphonis]|uniref:1-acyl-sn-glycerol-3-phosphate acyltransferase n=1 Tax=Aquicella siphonis TaxID=254247 RepID=A0A5E4PD57_9COXI|nr:lysophospholipid acyltransferase family protein [Aquicella siphonis]VVC74829.1 1-acyl-sn-glycerol-3-phosphate acyltransferase [Aquicella siphonis]
MFYLDRETGMKAESYSQFNLFVRSLIFSIYSAVTIILYSFICLASLPFPLRYRHGLIRAYMQVYFVVLKKVCHIDYRIEGLENIPKDRNGIILCKHQSTWETFFLPIYFHTPAAIAKRELAWVPFFGWGLAVSDPIFINRSNKKSSMQQIIEKGTKCLEQGRWIMVFPEGTRVPYGKVGQYKLGGARLAAVSGYPVIPVAHNAGKFWPRRKFIKQPGTITVVIGPLIESKDRRPEEILKLAKDWIESTMVRISGLVDESARQ